MVRPLIHGRDALRGPAQGYRAYLGRLPRPPSWESRTTGS